jgi:hypothetical protein
LGSCARWRAERDGARGCSERARATADRPGVGDERSRVGSAGHEARFVEATVPPEPNGLDKFDETVASERGAARVDFADVKAATLRSLDFIIPRLLPGGKRVGDEWVVRNPTRDDKKARSFSVNMRTGAWSDFAVGDKGGDMIDLYVYLNGGSNIQAKDALAEMLNVQARSGSTSNTSPLSPKRSAASTAAPGEFHEPPKAFPARTPPDKDGKPGFVVAGDEGPPARDKELRRHVYRQGDVPVRIKIINKDKKGGRKLKEGFNWLVSTGYGLSVR